MESKTRLKEGELLKLLADRSPLSKADIAKELKIRATTLSKIFKRQELSEKIKTEAVRFFKVPPEYFAGETITGADIPDSVQEVPPGYGIEKSIEVEEARLLAEIARLKEQARMQAELLAEKETALKASRETINRLLNLLDKKD